MYYLLQMPFGHFTFYIILWCTLSYSRFGNSGKFIMFHYVSVCLYICYSVLFLIANYVLFILFLVSFTSKSRILRVNKES